MRSLSIIDYLSVVLVSLLMALPFSGCVLYSSKFTHGNPQYCFSWTSKNLDLEQACKALESGLSFRQVAEEYQISKSAIQDYVLGRF